MVPRHYRPDSGKVVIAIQAFLIRTPRHTILVDSCVGNDKPRNREFFDRAGFPWMSRFLATGTRPEDIDFVLCTHLHVDHVGWNTRWIDERWEPTFPNARYVFTATDLESLQAKHAGADGQYVHVYEDSVKPILDAGLADLVAADHVVEEEEDLGQIASADVFEVRQEGLLRRRRRRVPGVRAPGGIAARVLPTLGAGCHAPT